MSKHTPGPWFQDHRKDPHGGGYRTQVFDGAGETIATLAWYPVRLSDTITTTNREANARLIAAAPEMLEALKDAVAGLRYIQQHHGHLYGVGWDRLHQWDAAIAKAEGLS